MIDALLLGLREGVEAALVVGIVLVSINRAGPRSLTRAVWAGVALAVVASLLGAVALERLRISQDGFEGLMMLLAAVFVVSMILWMNRAARHLRRHIEERVEGYARQATPLARLGLASFVFLLVAREGIELAILLRAVELTSEGLDTWIGALLGLALAVLVGILFFKGTLRIPLARFFAGTTVILMIVAFQLALTGLHELSEGMWIPSSKREMALIGPIVRNDVFFFVAILGVAGILVLREWLGAPARTASGGESRGAADLRRLAWERRTERRWLLAAAFTCLAVVLALTADFIYARAAAAPPAARSITPRGAGVRVPVADLADYNLHLYALDAGGAAIRFLAIRKRNGSYSAALDACQICGPSGYHQEGPNVICRNCGAAIYIPSIGETGGCNPIGLPSRVDAGDLVIDLQTLLRAARPPARR